MELLGLLILIVVYQLDRRLEPHKRELYVIGKSKEIEYLTPKELEKRLKHREDVQETDTAKEISAER